MVEYSGNFLKEAKKLSKKFKQLKTDLKNTLKEIEDEDVLGIYLGYNLYKKRMPNSSIPTGKSGGFRLIIYKKIDDRIVLVSIFSKTQKETLNIEELKEILKQYMESK